MNITTNAVHKSGVNTNGCQFKQPWNGGGTLSLSAPHRFLRAGLANIQVELLLQLGGQKCAFYPGITLPAWGQPKHLCERQKLQSRAALLQLFQCSLLCRRASSVQGAHTISPPAMGSLSFLTATFLADLLSLVAVKCNPKSRPWRGQRVGCMDTFLTSKITATAQ